MVAQDFGRETTFISRIWCVLEENNAIYWNMVRKLCLVHNFPDHPPY